MTAPITMLPVRLETRFAGTPRAPQLQVRIYPDDVHVDHHDPRLTASEVTAGKRYWSSTRSGDAQAWAQLLKDVGPTRAIWTRQALTPPTDTLTFPEVAVVDGTSGRSAMARALPSAFLVRARFAGGQQIVQGHAIPPGLQVGIAFGSVDAGAVAPAPPAAEDATRVLDEGMRWMVDFVAAEQVGMAVTIALPPGTNAVQDVVVVGIPVDGTPALAALVEAHRLSDGAAFLAPGTPTNNFADSASGYSISVVPPPPPVAPPAAGSAAAALAGAWGLDPLALAALDGGANRELDEARLMSRALFEATWGPFLRTQAQPGFDLAQLPEAFAHVTSFVRGGGPLPVLRLGRQPYAIAPVMARGTWADLADGPFVRWLCGFLPRIRPLWLSGVVDAPAGPDLLAQEPVSTRVRLRTLHSRPAIDFMLALGDAVVHGDTDASRHAMAAELGFATATASVLAQSYAKETATLWLPMSAEGDTTFDLLAPAPNDANSVLGLLLRNAAHGLVANATNEFGELAAGHAATAIARVAPAHPVVETHVQRVPTRGKDANGATFSIDERLGSIATGARTHAVDLTRYFNSDALADFRDALAAIGAIPPARRATLAGEILDCASHRYDAWVTSLATARLAGMRATQATNQVGAWGAVVGITRRAGVAVPASETIPGGTVTDQSGGGFVLAPSPRQASTAGVLRAAWRAHGGASGGATAPFATGLNARATRRALAIADGMRTGQPLGALLGYLLERGIQEATGVEIAWVVYELRRQYPLAIDTIDNAPQVSAQRLVIDGWKLAQVEIATPGAVVTAIPAQPLFGSAEQTALQGAIDDAVAALDAFSDLGLAESMYQLAGANLERAAAASDMLGRASPPPDRFEVVAPMRGGRGIEQRIVIAFGGAERPSGYASDTPRARLAPAADAFVAQRLGALDGIRVRFLDAAGAQLAAPMLSALKLSALDLGALALSNDNVARVDDRVRTTSNPGRQGVMRLVLASGVASAVTIGVDRETDAALLDLLDHAAAWNRALAGRRPLTADTFIARSRVVSPPAASQLAVMVAALAQELASAGRDALVAWGVADAAAARARVATAAVLADPVDAAGALLGGPAVVEGAVAVPADVSRGLTAQPSVLGPRKGMLARWLEDSARVRPAAAALVDAMLRDDLAARATVGVRAAQTPSAPYVDGSTLAWVGGVLAGPLGDAPVTSAVIIGDDANGVLVGVELDAWTEVVPAAAGNGAVTANLRAPAARAPNVILIGVPPDVTKAWTQEALLSVVDEALELAACRMVDLDATRRAPGLLPAAYIAEYDPADLDIHHLLGTASTIPVRWVAEKTS